MFQVAIRMVFIVPIVFWWPGIHSIGSHFYFAKTEPSDERYLGISLTGNHGHEEATSSPIGKTPRKITGLPLHL